MTAGLGNLNGDFAQALSCDTIALRDRKLHRCQTIDLAGEPIAWLNWPYPSRRATVNQIARSYYEEVLVVRVHPELLKRQHLPLALVGKAIWDERLADMARFEDYADRQGIKILKCFLHVSREEQKKRFIERLDEPEKNWKFSESDVQERKFWGDYMAAYEAAIKATASKQAPWYVLPADHKWFSRLVVAAIIVDALGNLGLAYPKVDAARKKELAAARAALARER